MLRDRAPSPAPFFVMPFPFSLKQLILGSGFFKAVLYSFFYFCPCSSAVEHFLGKEEVSGSSPDMGSIFSAKKTSLENIT
jgi:hypothetical protein